MQEFFNLKFVFLKNKSNIMTFLQGNISKIQISNKNPRL